MQREEWQRGAAVDRPPAPIPPRPVPLGLGRVRRGELKLSLGKRSGGKGVVLSLLLTDQTQFHWQYINLSKVEPVSPGTTTGE